MKGGIRAPRTPGGTWAYRIDSASGSDGRRGQRQVAGFSSREEAETALADALAAQGGDDVKTVAGFLERIWLPAKASDVERSTLDQYAWAVRRHVNPVLGSLKLADLGPEVLEGWLARLARPVPETGEAPLGATSVRVVRRCCGSRLTLCSPRRPAPGSPWSVFGTELNLLISTAGVHRVTPDGLRRIGRAQ